MAITQNLLAHIPYLKRQVCSLFDGRQTTRMTAVIQPVHRTSYTSYYGRRTITFTT
ncbi:MAG: hypothetical protein HG458_001490 [Prevotella sp.]|nr:hypothetical protein [Prevotella sp.]